MGLVADAKSDADVMAIQHLPAGPRLEFQAWDATRGVVINQGAEFDRTDGIVGIDFVALAMFQSWLGHVKIGNALSGHAVGASES